MLTLCKGINEYLIRSILGWDDDRGSPAVRVRADALRQRHLPLHDRRRHRALLLSRRSHLHSAKTGTKQREQIGQFVTI